MTYRGHDELAGMMNAGLWTAATTVGLFALLLSRQLEYLAFWAVAASLTPVIWFGARYRLDVTQKGVLLTKFWLWPFRRRRSYYLDCSAAFYDSWESDRVEGVYLDTGSLLEDSDVFGPYFDQRAMVALADDVNSSIASCRQRVAGRRDLNVVGLKPSDFDVLERSPGGPPRTVRNRSRVRFRGFEVPAHSTWVLRYDGWVDPRRVDEVRSIELNGPTMLPTGLEVPAGARLSLGTAGRRSDLQVHGADLLNVVEGIVVAGGAETVGLADGVLVEYTTAEPVRKGDFVLPAGTRLRRWDLLGKEAWSVTLGGAMRVAGIDLCENERVTFDRSWRPLFVSPNRRLVTVGEVTLEGDLSTLVVKRNGKLDLRDCRARGFAEKSMANRASDLFVNAAECGWFYTKMTLVVVIGSAFLVQVLNCLGV